MANPNIKFFRNQNAPANPAEGYVWFKTDDRTINLYKNGAWETYAGIIEASYTNNVLNITPSVGDAITIDLSGMASADTLDTLSQNFNALSEEFTTEKGKISALQEQMTNVQTEVAKLEGITDKVTTYVVGKISEEETARKNADTAFDGRISTLETGYTTLVGSDTGSIRDIATTVLTETLVSETASEAFDTLQEVSAWIKEHPESAATMNEAISSNTEKITNVEEQIATINTVIEENELTVATALTDLDARILALSSGTIASVNGQGYITTANTDGNVVVSATTGSVANGDNAIAIASDVKSYVDSVWAWGEF